MYRPSLYNKHNESMEHFSEKFNSCPVCRHIKMEPHPVETFDNDGVFVDTKTGKSIGYDWEYRKNYFANCIFRFKTLGQYERKLQKESIQLSLQCDSTETGIAVGWHEDWLREPVERKALKTVCPQDEDGSVRNTRKFKIYSFEEMASFKRMVAAAMERGIYSSRIFQLAENGWGAGANHG